MNVIGRLEDYYHIILSDTEEEEILPTEEEEVLPPDATYVQKTMEEAEIINDDVFEMHDVENDGDGSDEVFSTGPTSFEIASKLNRLVNKANKREEKGLSYDLSDRFIKFFDSLAVSSLSLSSINYQVIKALQEANPDFNFNFISAPASFVHPDSPIFGACIISRN